MEMDSRLRVLYMGKLLYELTDEEHYLTTAQLVQLLEEKYGITTHRQTIKRDIEVLQKFGMDIQETKSTQNRYNLVSRKFDVAELRLLIDAVESAKFITARKSQELSGKISSLAGVNQADRLKSNLSAEGRIKTDNEKIYIIIDTVNEAINSSRKITFQYFKYDLNKHKILRHGGLPYVVSPLQLVWNGEYYYMIAINEDGELRNFRMDRIAKCPEILPEAAKPAPEDFEVSSYLNTTIRMFSAESGRVELLCDNSILDAVLDRFGLESEIARYDETHFTAVVEASVSNLFLGWIFAFGGLIKILGPEPVRLKFQELISRQLTAGSASSPQSR